MFPHRSEAVTTQQEARVSVEGKRGVKGEKKREKGRVHMLVRTG